MSEPNGPKKTLAEICEEARLSSDFCQGLICAVEALEAMPCKSNTPKAMAKALRENLLLPPVAPGPKTTPVEPGSTWRHRVSGRKVSVLEVSVELVHTPRGKFRTGVKGWIKIQDHRGETRTIAPESLIGNYRECT